MNHSSLVTYLCVYMCRLFSLPEGETTIGRGDDCDVTICAHSLSRQHAQILVEEGSHFIQDLASRNKTFRKLVSQ